MVGLGCMRLSTEADRDESTATATLHAALDAGVTLLDTARRVLPRPDGDRLCDGRTPGESPGEDLIKRFC